MSDPPCANSGGEALVDFGFAKAEIPPGTHVCQIFEDDDERNDAFIRFLQKGLELRELTAGFSDDLAEPQLARRLTGREMAEELELARTSDVYFQNRRFDPEGMLELLSEFFDRSRSGRFSGSRVIGEMAPEIHEMEGANRLLEYEARVNLLIKERPMTVMCQYNAHRFDGSTLMDVLKAHALMVVRGTIVHNPFYVPPETLLANL